MALTKVSGSIIKDPLNLGEVSIGGTLTYQDVTNVDSLGIGTFRAGINVSGGQLDVGSNIKIGNAGVITATSLVATNATLLAGGTADFRGGFISNAGVSTFAGNIDANGDIDVDGHTELDNVNISGIVTAGLVSIPVAGNLQVGGAGSGETDSKVYVANTGGNAYIQLKGADSSGTVGLKFGRNSVANRAGIDWSASTDALVFRTGGTGEKLRITSSGQLLIGTDSGSELLCIKRDDTTGPTITLENNANKAYINNWGSVGGGSGRTNRFEINATLQAQASICAPYITFMIGNAGDSYEKLRIDSNGHLLPGTDNALDLGSSSKRWRNIYTGDLQLSNVTPSSNGGEPVGDGAGNEVDGTEGTWTIQEGLNDLFLINRINGKKYKFNLTEVS